MLKLSTISQQVRYWIAIVFTFSFQWCSYDADATTYYIDALAGDDGSLGTTTQLPWQSLDRVNQFTFQPGDSVLFKRGSVWHGMLNITNEGIHGQPIFYGAYGLGEKPIIHGDGKSIAAIFVRNSANYITVADFAVTNFDSLDTYDGAEGLRSGIHVGEWLGEMTMIQILDNEVFYVEGCSNHPTVGSPRGTSLDPDVYNKYQNAGIFAHAAYIDTLIISGNYVHDCTCSGIFPFLFENATELLLEHNSVYNVGGDGIVILHATSPLIQLNSVILAGNNSGPNPRMEGEIGFNGLAVAGIWSSLCSDPLFQYNYCEGTRRIVWDGQPWDFDIATTGRAIYQYNFSRDNEGGFNLGGEPHQLFRYNISYNDGAKQGDFQYFFNGSPTYYNNTFYRNDQQGFLMNGDLQQTFTNNIFYTNGAMNYSYQGDSSTFSHNCYTGHIPLSPGSSFILDDPLFVNPDNVGKIMPGVKFSIQDLRAAVMGLLIGNESACRETGLSIPENGEMDFWGNSLYFMAPDIGAHEYQSPNALSERGISKLVTSILYPNPTRDRLYFSIQGRTYSGYKISDLWGRVIESHPLQQNAISIDTSGLPEGSYVLLFQQEGLTTSSQIFVVSR